ncbi:RsmE family RNA methyltransferase [Candidatus Caldatribacterium saccharofermentans]|uniref:RsmE family RNA methyltransferase n=1 Tax=Candidatus Caldatribacterium saccharofermentans TaxID=1454753 RepID=UPI003D01E6BB
MARFLFHPTPRIGEVIALSPEETHHLWVQRVPLRTPVLVGDGKGGLYRGILLDRKDEHALVLIEEKVEDVAPSFFLSVWQGFLKSPARMDWMIEKLVEIGVTEIGFFPAERSVKERISKDRMARWERIVVSACKQSGRTWFPVVRVFESWEDFLVGLSRKRQRVFLADASCRERLLEVLQRGEVKGSAALIVGPEGDFSEKEKKALSRIGVYPVFLGGRILRSETAALFGASLLVAFMEGNHADRCENPRM